MSIPECYLLKYQKISLNKQRFLRGGYVYSLFSLTQTVDIQDILELCSVVLIIYSIFEW